MNNYNVRAEYGTNYNQTGMGQIMETMQPVSASTLTNALLQITDQLAKLNINQMMTLEKFGIYQDSVKSANGAEQERDDIGRIVLRIQAAVNLGVEYASTINGLI